MIIHLRLIGILLMLLGLLHIVFPRYFNWKEELKPLSLINKQLMLIHTFFIALTVFLMGLLCVTSSKDMLETDLGKTICLGLAVFWGVRLVIQFFGYSSKIWKGKKFETAIHILAGLFWTYLTVVFGIGYLN